MTAEEEGLKSGKFLFDERMVLYSKIRPYLRKVARPDFSGLCSADVYPLRPASGRLDRDFLSHLLMTPEFTDYAVLGSARAGMPKVNREHLFAFEFLLPPLAEQQRIVAILDEAFEDIATAKANAEKNLQNAEAIVDSRLDTLLKEPDPSSVHKTLGSVVERLTNGYVGPTRNIYVENGVPYLLARHVRDNRLAFDGRTFIAHDFNQKNRKSILKRDDVLLVQSGHIGHSAVVTAEHEGHNCHAMIVITPSIGLTGSYLSLLFNTPKMKRKFEEIRSGSTVPHLTCREVRKLVIPIPTAKVQQEIVEAVNKLRDECVRLQSIHQQKLAALEALKKSLLHEAFSGNL